MDIINLIPALWELLKNKKCAINVTTIDNALAVSIIKRKRIKKRFVCRNNDSQMLLADIRSYLQV
jgi:hypothetical protein